MKKLIFIGFLLAATHVFAESAAKVLYIKNKVVASGRGGERALARGAALNPGDQITTYEGAAVHLQYTNGTLVNLGANSSYKILAYSPKQEIQINAELFRGKLETRNKGKIKETLKTPLVSLAILGTHIRVNAVRSAKPISSVNVKKNRQCDGPRAREITYVDVIEGLVSAGGKLLKPGRSVRITCDQIIDVSTPQGSAAGGADMAYVATNQMPGTLTAGGIDAVLSVTVPVDISLLCIL